MPLAPVFFLKIALTVQGLFCFQTICKHFCSISMKNVIGNFVEMALNLLVTLGSVVIFPILINPLQEHGISLHLFVSSLILFISPYSFLSTGLLPP